MLLLAHGNYWKQIDAEAYQISRYLHFKSNQNSGLEMSSDSQTYTYKKEAIKITVFPRLTLDVAL